MGDHEVLPRNARRQRVHSRHGGGGEFLPAGLDGLLGATQIVGGEVVALRKSGDSESNGAAGERRNLHNLDRMARGTNGLG